MTLLPGPHDALIIIDVQNDFLPGGALAVSKGDEIIAPLNALSALPFGCVVASQDWHPPDHISFVAQGGMWPMHCVRNHKGAALADALDQTHITSIIRKGRSPERDSYSAFFDNDGRETTGLHGLLRALGVTRVFTGGLAFDYCVAATARDATKLGFESIVLTDVTRAVSANTTETERELTHAGVRLL